MKKTLRKILSIALAVVMLFSFTTVAYAVEGDVAPCAGTETWYAGNGKVGSFTLSGNNLTPVKTMGATGNLTVYGFADVTTNDNIWWVEIQIIDYKTGDVIAETSSKSRNSNGQAYSLSFDVVKGQKIRIFMYYGSMPDTDAYVSIYYLLD